MNKKIWSLLSCGLVAIFCCSCQIETKREEKAQPLNDKPLVDPKYSLNQDRSSLDELRSAIPADKKMANDEKALLLEWMADFKKSPSDIREKFDSLVRKKRELFNKDITKVREKYTKQQEQKRKDFLKNLANERADFLNQKKSTEARNEFFSLIEEKRKNYFAEERENRDDFESNIRDQRKNFEDYLNEKKLDFNSELKAYTEKYNEFRKNK